MANLIVSTASDLLVLENGKAERSIFDGEHGHYGITWSEEALFASCGKHDDLYGVGAWIALLDHNLEVCNEILHGRVPGVHQIQWHDGRLWACASNSDEIVISTHDGQAVDVWKPCPDSPTSRHINSIWFDEGFVYTVAHAFGRSPSYYIHTYPGLSLEAEIPMPTGHNIYRHQGHIMTLGIGAIHWNSRSYPCPQPALQMCKGLAALDDKIYVGVHRFIRDRAERRGDRIGHIIEIVSDDLSHNPKGDIELNCGPINEIRVLDEPDYAHHGQPWTGRYGA